MRYSHLKPYISLVINITVLLLLFICTYRYGYTWFFKSDDFTRYTFLIGIAIWILFIIFWKIGKWYTNERQNKITMQHLISVPLNIGNATPDIESFLMGGSLALVLCDLGKVSIPEGLESIYEFIGINFLFLGFIVALWGRIILGLQWSRDVHVPASLVKTGPYKFVRNPIYSGEIIMSIGSSIWAHNFLVLVLLFGGMFVFNFIRALAEEKVLLQCFGEEYLSFAKERPRFFPSVLKKR